MALPTQRSMGFKYYSVYAASLSAAASPSFPVTGRGRVVDIRYTPLVSPTTTATSSRPR
jgi:hypothetical protein